MESPLTLNGRVAFITGSSRGIGLATARTLARYGATIILNGRSSQELIDRVATELRKEFDVPCIGLSCDAADSAAVKACYVKIFKEFRRLDILVNNAGVLQGAFIGMISESLVRTAFETNAMGAIYHLQEASRLMARNQGGSIINVTSIIGQKGNEGQTVYGASKAALIGMTLSAAKELAAKKIRVNAVAPGFINTDMIRQLSETKFAESVASIRMGRIGEPQDVANAILFLASDLSSYITGQILGVDGGMLI